MDLGLTGCSVNIHTSIIIASDYNRNIAYFEEDEVEVFDNSGGDVDTVPNNSSSQALEFAFPEDEEGREEFLELPPLKSLLSADLLPEFVFGCAIMGRSADVVS